MTYRRARKVVPIAPIALAILLLLWLPAPAPARTPAASGAEDRAPPFAPATPTAPSIAWTNLTAALPGPRVGAGLAPLAPNDTALVYGGQNTTGLLNSTELYNESVNTWTTLTPPVTPGPDRDFGLAALPNGTGAVLFGGLTNTSTGLVSNATWLFTGSTDRWSNVSGPVAPPPREDPAFAVGDGFALLYGGWDPDAGGSGALIYSDLWALNLTTFNWTRLAPSGPGPGPLRGASLVWQPNFGQFVLYGGCYPCTSTTWSYQPTLELWNFFPAGGAPPPGRMNAVFAWDPTTGDDLLFGGWNGTAWLGDTAELNLTQPFWFRLDLPVTPGPRAQSAAGFLDAPGNATLLVSGGANASGLLDTTWRLASTVTLVVQALNGSSGAPLPEALVDENSLLGSRTNGSGEIAFPDLPSNETRVNATAPGYATAATAIWPSPGATVWLPLNLSPVAPAQLELNVTSIAGVPLPNATVMIYLDGLAYANLPSTSKGVGVSYYPAVPAATAQFVVGASGYHTANDTVLLPPGRETHLVFALTPLLWVEAHVLGLLPSGSTVPLTGAKVVIGTAAEGLSNEAGWLNFSTAKVAKNPIATYAFGFQSHSENVSLPASGILRENVTLAALAFPVITVQVLEAGTSGATALLPGATVNVTSTSPAPPEGAYAQSLTTDAAGFISVSPYVGNYTITAWDPGFDSNSVGGIVVAGPGQNISRSIYLAPIPLSSLHVHVVSSAAGAVSIAGAEVQLSFTERDAATGGIGPVELHDTSAADGWVNFTALPGAVINVTGTAPGYFPNSTLVALDYDQNLSDLVLPLTPVPPGRFPSLTFFAPDPARLGALLLVPIVVVIGAVVYLTALRNPAPEPAPPRPARSKPGG
jgi:hypothetical protein